MSDSTPVIVVAVVDIKPGSEDEALAAFETGIQAAHTEPGCVTYALHRDNAEPSRFIFVERWASQADLDAHFEQPQFKALGEKLGSLLTGAPVLYQTTAVPVGDAAKGTVA